MKIRLKELRSQKGWSQQQTAAVAGVSIDCIKSIEVGRANPSLKTAFQLKKAFGCQSIDELIEEAI